MDEDIVNLPLVSIIMPVFNGECFIEESIKSVIDQTYQNWELLIIDDGSTDKTRRISESYASKDMRIMYFYQENSKQGKARNKGLMLAKGELVAFLDSDDLWLPQKLDLQLKLIFKKNVDMVFSDSFLFSGLEASCRELIHFNIDSGFYSIKEIGKMLEMNRVPILTVLCKKRCIDAVGGFTENLKIQNAEDYHLWLKLLLADFKFYGSDMILAKYRNHVGSSTNEDKLSITSVLYLLDDLKADIANRNISVRYFFKIWLLRYFNLPSTSKKEYISKLKVVSDLEYKIIPTVVFYFLFCFHYKFSKRLLFKYLRNV